MIQRMSCIVLVAIHDWMQRPEIDSFLEYTSVGDIQLTGTTSIKKVVAAMIDWGHRYANIEQMLGQGICLCLGTELPESQ